MSNQQIMAVESQYTSGVYPKREIAIVRGKGARLWDGEGNEYIDCVAGQGVANLGHCHPKIVRAIEEQSQNLITCPEIFYNDTRSKFLQTLAGVLPGDLKRIYLCNSGAEAVEAAFKFARFLTKRQSIVATMRGFHGRTFGALSATWEKKYRQPFAPLVPEFQHLPYGNLAKMAEMVNETTAAVILEVIQGEGGVRPGQSEYLKGVQQLCRDNGALLIIDEVQTGFGRTGKWFACEHHQLVPDILSLGKAIAGGIPMGAVALSDKVPALSSGIHGSTFGGNPLACAAGQAALEAYEEEGLIERAATLGNYALNKLRQQPLAIVREIRGTGLMIGMELKTRVTPILKQLMEEGVLALPAGATVLRLLPPLVISQEELDLALDKVIAVLASTNPPTGKRSRQ